MITSSTFLYAAGASSAITGIFSAAATGTLLLEEISEMPLSLQAKLLLR